MEPPATATLPRRLRLQVSEGARMMLRRRNTEAEDLEIGKNEKFDDDADDEFVMYDAQEDLEIGKNEKFDDDADDEFVMHLELQKAATNGTLEQFQLSLQQITAKSNDSPATVIDRAKLLHTSLIHAALSAGNEDVALFLAENHPSLILDKNTKGDTAIHVAARCGMRRIVGLETCLTHDILVIENVHGNIPLHEAVMNGDYEVVDILISKNPMSICNENKQGLSAFCMAIQNGHMRIFDLMHLICRDHILVLDRFKEVAEPPAHAAISVGRKDILNRMASQCKQLLKLRDKKGQTPLHFAAGKGDIDAVRLLVSHTKTSCNQMDFGGFLPIHIASRKGHVKVIKELLDYCSDPKVLLTRGKGQNILHIAAENGRDNVVRYILSNPKLRELLNERDNDGNSPLHLAAKNSHPAVVLSLTWDKNIELNPLNNECSSPLDVFSDSQLGSYFEQHLLQHEMTLSALIAAGCEASWANKKSTSDERSSDAESRKENRKIPKKILKYEWMNDNVGALLTIATLVATGTFTVGFTMPGGSISSGDKNEGTPTFLNNNTFQFFMICNTIAFFCSIICIISCFYTKYADILVAARSYYLAVVLFGLSLLMMSLAFTAAIQLAISNVSWLTYVTLVIAIIFLVFLFFAWVVDAFPLHWRNPVVRFVSFYVIRGCMFVFLRKY